MKNDNPDLITPDGQFVQKSIPEDAVHCTGGLIAFRKGHEFTDDELLAYLAIQESRPLADFRVAQLAGWGADNFLISADEQHFMIGASFGAASGSMDDRAYMANAINTWGDLAKEVLRLREDNKELRLQLEDLGVVPGPAGGVPEGSVESVD